MKDFNDDNDFDSFLRGKLREASLSPPNSERAWKNISHNLPQSPRDKRKIAGVVVFICAMLALLLLYDTTYIPGQMHRVDRPGLAIIQPIELISEKLPIGLAENTDRQEMPRGIAVNGSLHKKQSNQKKHRKQLCGFYALF
jgi:hypothetical protein